MWWKFELKSLQIQNTHQIQIWRRINGTAVLHLSLAKSRVCRQFYKLTFVISPYSLCCWYCSVKGTQEHLPLSVLCVCWLPLEKIKSYIMSFWAEKATESCKLKGHPWWDTKIESGSAPLIKIPPISKLPGIHAFQSSTQLFTAYSIAGRSRWEKSWNVYVTSHITCCSTSLEKNVKHHQSSGFKA